MKEQAYQNGKIVGMMKGARILQDLYVEPEMRNKYGIDKARAYYAKECEKEGFDMFAYLRGDLLEPLQ